MDIIVHLPRNHHENRHMLVIGDYVSRYPEAIPLRSIDTPHVTEELVKFFFRVGISEEILTDQGSNFMSKFLT